MPFFKLSNTAEAEAGSMLENKDLACVLVPGFVLTTHNDIIFEKVDAAMQLGDTGVAAVVDAMVAKDFNKAVLSVLWIQVATYESAWRTKNRRNPSPLVPAPHATSIVEHRFSNIRTCGRATQYADPHSSFAPQAKSV